MVSVASQNLSSCFLLRLLVRRGQETLSWQTGTPPAGFEPKPALVESPPAQVAHGSPQLLGGELGEVCEQTQQQEHPESQQEHAEEEEEAQRSAGRPLQGRGLVQMEAEDGQLLNQQQAAEAEEEDVLGHFVAPPQPPSSEAGGPGLVFMQQQQRLRRGRGAVAFLGRGDGLITSSRRVLQEGEETPAGPAQEPQHQQPREVFEGAGGRATGRDGEEEDEGARQGARPAPGGAEELPVRQVRRN